LRGSLGRGTGEHVRTGEGVLTGEDVLPGYW
jgi:hypothetical protein